MLETRSEAADVIAEIAVADEAGTERLAGRLARVLRAGDLVALSGDLGAGKTAFARAIVRALGRLDQDVPSPTFTLVQDYDVTLGDGTVGVLRHADLYRIGDPSEVEELGLDDGLDRTVLLVEWPERGGSALPGARLDVTLSFRDTSDSRLFRFEGDEIWRQRLAGLDGVA